MKNLDWKGLFLGGFFYMIGTLLITLVFTLVKVLVFGSAEGSSGYELHEFILLLVACFLSYLWAGFIVSKTSSKGKVLNPLIIASLIAVSAFYTDKLPLWYMVVTGIFAIPIVYSGALLHLKRANKVTEGI
mgnify:CR=1 FL=1